MNIKEQLKTDLYKLGICKGDVLLMHSSYKSLGFVEGGAFTVFEALKETIGEEGTLILPALSFNNVTREQSFFDRELTPVCIGYLPEYFRTQVTGVVRSLHATHSCCAWGKYAEEIIKNHEKDITPVGKNSPFAKLPQYNGKILMLGCNRDRNTSMHGVEESIDPIPNYCIDFDNPVVYTLKDKDKTIEVKSYRHNFVNKDGGCIGQCYSKIIGLLKKNEVSHGYVLEADCTLMDAKALWKRGRSKMLQDPLYFVEY